MKLIYNSLPIDPDTLGETEGAEGVHDEDN